MRLWYGHWHLELRMCLKKKWKKHSLWDCGMVTGRLGQKPDWKKMTPSVRQWYGHWRLPGMWERGMWSLTFRVENVLEKKMKKPGLWDRGMVTGRLGQKLDWKKMTRSVRQWYGHWRFTKFWMNLNKIFWELRLNYSE